MFPDMDRKKFLKLTLLLVLLYPLKFILSMTSITRGQDNNKKLFEKIPIDVPDGITFYDSFFSNKSNNTLRFYSTKCTHLGCKIKKQENSQLVCRCHGSRFDTNGRVITGPATRDLPPLEYSVEHKEKKIVVKLLA